jgi:hypothetical protein
LLLLILNSDTSLLCSGVIHHYSSTNICSISEKRGTISNQ